MMGTNGSLVAVAGLLATVVTLPVASAAAPTQGTQFDRGTGLYASAMRHMHDPIMGVANNSDVNLLVEYTDPVYGYQSRVVPAHQDTGDNPMCAVAIEDNPTWQVTLTFAYDTATPTVRTTHYSSAGNPKWTLEYLEANVPVWRANYLTARDARARARAALRKAKASGDRQRIKRATATLRNRDDRLQTTENLYNEGRFRLREIYRGNAYCDGRKVG